MADGTLALPAMARLFQNVNQKHDATLQIWVAQLAVWMVAGFCIVNQAHFRVVISMVAWFRALVAQFSLCLPQCEAHRSLML